MFHMIGISNMTSKKPLVVLSGDASALWVTAVLNQNPALKKTLDTQVFAEFINGNAQKLQDISGVFGIADEISGGMTNVAIQIQEETKFSGSYMPNHILQKKLDEMRGYEKQLIYAIEGSDWRGTFKAFELNDSANVDLLAHMFAKKDHCAVSAAIFIALLDSELVEDQSSLNIIQRQRILAGLRDTALGVKPDGLGVKPDRSYHTLQLMNYTPGAIKMSLQLPGDLTADSVVDLSLPQARSTTKYNLKLLIDRALVSSLGPIASKTTGINYKLIQRMRSLVMVTPKNMTPKPLNEKTKALPSRGFQVLSNQPAYYTTDSGQTHQELYLNSVALKTLEAFEEIQKEGQGVWLPFAGAMPRLHDLNEINAAIIIPALDTDQGSEKLRLFENITRGAAQAPISDGRVSNDIFIPILVEEFGNACAKTYPQSPSNLVKLFLPENFYTELDFVYLALHRVGSLVRGQQLTDTQIAVSKVTTSSSELARETMLTQMVQTTKASAELRGLLEAAFRNHKWHADFENDKGGLAKEFKKIYLGITTNHIIYGSPPTIKLFDLGLIL